MHPVKKFLAPLRKPLTRFIRHRERKLHLYTTANNPRHSDIYIVEFPKSGLTWFSTMLANMALISSGSAMRATFASVRNYVPSVYRGRDIGPMPYHIPPVRFIKSHSQFNPNYIIVFYLVRKPLDVMKSYFRYRRAFGAATGSFSDFVKSDKFGIPAWKRHINSWCTGDLVNQQLTLVRYEDLLRDPVAELAAINTIYGWNINSAVLESAAEMSASRIMKSNEQLYSARNPRYTMEFVRGNDTVAVDEATLKYIEQQCQPELELLGYTELQAQ